MINSIKVISNAQLTTSAHRKKRVLPKKCSFRNQEGKWLIQQVRVPTPATCDSLNRLEFN